MNLATYVASTAVEDLETLAFLTGVEHATLELISAAATSPGPTHVAAIRRVLPDLPDAVLFAHARPAPVTIQTRRGTIPRHTTLQTVAADGLQVGDLVAYQPAAKYGSHWVPMVTPPRPEGYLLQVTLGGVDVPMRPDSILRVARPDAPPNSGELYFCSAAAEVTPAARCAADEAHIAVRRTT